MASESNSNERYDRRDGWTGGGPGLTLADGAAWFLPPIDDGIIPYLPGLVPAITILHRLDDRYRDGNVPAEQLVATLAIYLLEALTIQYRTQREVLAELIAPALLRAVLGDQADDRLLASHIDDLWEFAVRQRLVRKDGSSVRSLIN